MSRELKYYRPADASMPAWASYPRGGVCVHDDTRRRWWGRLVWVSVGVFVVCFVGSVVGVLLGIWVDSRWGSTAVLFVVVGCLALISVGVFVNLERDAAAVERDDAVVDELL